MPILGELADYCLTENTKLHSGNRHAILKCLRYNNRQIKDNNNKQQQQIIVKFHIRNGTIVTRHEHERDLCLFVITARGGADK